VIEWHLSRDRILRIDVYWYKRRRKPRPPERKRDPEVEAVLRRIRERKIREAEERSRRRAAERGEA
jgi:hypothetical protein